MTGRSGGIRQYQRRVHQNLQTLLRQFASYLEQQLKTGAWWIDRTGEARRELHVVTDFSTHIYYVILYGGAAHNIWLELKPIARGGRPIIGSTMSANQSRYRQFIRLAGRL